MIPFLILISGRVLRRPANPKATCCLSSLCPFAPLPLFLLFLCSIPAMGWRGPCCGLCPGYALFQGHSPPHHCLCALFPVNSKRKRLGRLPAFLTPHGLCCLRYLCASNDRYFVSSSGLSVRNDRYFDSSSGLSVSSDRFFDSGSGLCVQR